VNSLLSREATPWLAVVMAWGLAFSLVCRISLDVPITPPDEGVIDLLFGESRSALSADLYARADTFFHRGVAHSEKRVLTNDWIQAWRADIAPASHRHAEGSATAEILPWLQLATQADPRNVEASLVLAFWISTGLNRPDLANRVLLDAQRLNPMDYRIPLEMGRIAIRGGSFDQAQSKLFSTLARWPSPLKPTDREAMLDKTESLTLLGFISELKGNNTEAIAQFKNALAIFPERSYIVQRVAQLEAGETPPDSARERLAALVRQTVHDACKDEHEGHDEHSHTEELPHTKDKGHVTERSTL
jgi:tetratricopeptide (TPR) repeat protein